MKFKPAMTTGLAKRKPFSIAPLAIALVGLLFAVPAQTAVPAAGDLNIYSAGKRGDATPTIMLIVEGSTFTNNADQIAGAEWIGTSKPSTNLYPNSLPVYDRNYYFPTGAINEPTKWSYTRLTRMKDAIYYLMDTPGALPDEYKVGIGRYSSSTLSIKNMGDGLTGSINVPAKPLGPVSDSNNPDSQRYKIKQFVADMCSFNRFCTGNAPMASAYAEAGAYMMGTKTSRLTYEKDGTKNLSTKDASESEASAMPYTRALRKGSGNKWQYCPPSNRSQIRYDTPQGIRIRIECPDDETVTLADGSTQDKTYWVDIDENNIADKNWTGTSDAEPTEREVNRLTADEKKYDLLWDGTAPLGAGRVYDRERISPKTLIFTSYHFNKDDFQNKSPTTAKPEGQSDSWDYFIDENLVPDKRLVPVLRYRALRQKFVGYKNKDANGSLTPTRIWQYCPKEKAELVNYIYSSYRLMCKEDDWLDMAIYNTKGKVDDTATDARLKTAPFKPEWKLEWHGGFFPAITRGGRPAGINGLPLINPSDRYFIVDGLLNPYDGWQYYYDTGYTQQDYPPLPPTLNTTYSVSGIRNSPPEVRNHQSYTYNKPSYSECSGQTQYDTSGQTTTAGAESVENLILFFTAGWPYSVIAKPLNEMNMSLTSPATSNTLDPVSGAMTTTTCAASGLSVTGTNPAGNHWDCIGEYSKRLRMGKQIGDATKTYSNPANASIKTGVFMFTANNEEMTSTGTDANGLPEYSCVSSNTSQRNACLLGKYGAGYGEGGFIQSTSSTAEASYQLLSKSLSKMQDAGGANAGMVPTSMPIVPQNPLQSNKLLEYGYLPLLQPGSQSNQAHWAGNVRKYKQTPDGFIGKDSYPYSPFAGTANAILAPSTLDFWAKEAGSFKSSQQAGGAYSQIPMPTATVPTTRRNVYLSQDVNSSSSSNILVPYTPDNIGSVAISSFDVTKNNTLRMLLLNYMGYPINNYVNSTTGTEGTKASDIIATLPTDGSGPKFMGGVYHSTPVALVAKAKRPDAASDYAKDKTFIMFGAMDNALHIVDDSTGVEVMSYFPREVLANNGQYKGITPALSAEAGEATPSFGVDAPWTSYVQYDYAPGAGGKPDNSTLIASKLYAFGGARLGAKAYYGLKLTGLDKVVSANNLGGFKPEQMFTITPDTVYGGVKVFDRLGYTWAKPVITEINWQGKRKLVAILSGGYDATEYDKPDGQRSKDGMAATTEGNAIYIVDVENGKPLVIAGQSGTGTTVQQTADFATQSDAAKPVKVYNDDLKYSITGAVKVLDRDADELADHLYFADLNGQVFRMDIDNIASTAAVGTEPAKNTKVRLVTLAKLTQTTGKPGPRFYETPVVTIQQDAGTKKRFATVSMASGDRSNPLRITNPSKETASITVTYTNSGGQQTVKAAYKASENKWIAVSGFGDANGATLVTSDGTVTLADRKAGTPVTAKTTFLTTDTVSSSTDKVNSDPLAPTITVGDKVTVTLATTGTAIEPPNYVYTLYDKDVTSVNLFSTPASSLQTKRLTFTADKFPDVTKSDSAALKSGAASNYDKWGWRAPLSLYGEGVTNSNNAIKAIGPLSALDNKLYLAAYNPIDKKTDVTGCTAQVVGNTEVYQFCLPYGICADGSYSNQFERTKYGKGILPMSWATDANGENRKLIGQYDWVTKTTTDAAGTQTNKNEKGVDAGKGLNTAGSSPTVAREFSLDGIFKPMVWFDYALRPSSQSK